MKKVYFSTVLLCFVMVLMINTRLVKAQVDTVTITLYADCRSWANMIATPGSPDSAANAHNISQFASYNPGVLYLTGHWSPPTAPDKTDWTFFKMDSIKPNIFKVTFKYPVGFFPGNTTDDPDLLPDNPGWYFAPTNDWSTQEFVPPPCNVAWDVQRIFQINIYKADTTVAFKYGVCDPITFCSLDIPDICVQQGISETGISEGISVYPNPTADVVSLKNDKGINFIKVFDYTGRMAKQLQFHGESDVNFSIKDLPSQLYLLQIQHSNGSVSYSKLMKR